jgi:hypothetical protein
LSETYSINSSQFIRQAIIEKLTNDMPTIRNKYKEKFANSYNQVFNLFAKIQIKALTIFPAIFANYEYSKGLLVNGNLEASTNIDVLLLGPSLDLSYKSFVLNTSYQFNVYERVSSQQLSNAGRFVIGLTYNFDQNKYLIKSKN